MIRDQLADSSFDVSCLGRKRNPAFAGVVISVFIHCAVGIGLERLQADVYLHRQREVEPRSSVVVYIQPAVSHAQQKPVVRPTARLRPFPVSRLAPERKRTGMQARPATMPEADKPVETDPRQVEASVETPLRLNAAELKALVKQDLERERVRSGHAAGSREQAVLTADAGQEALEQARRPKCDKDYKPKVGSVEFSGLMKLPFLLRGALSDKGCKL